MSIPNQLAKIKSEIPQNCTLVAVSKTKPNEDILEAFASGQLDFGENKVQELAMKAEELSKEIKWHFIGHLQRNKVKYIAPFVHLIHGVDSERLLLEIDKQGSKNNRTIDCLLQIHIAQEETKFGLNPDEARVLLKATTELPNIRIKGLMGMATNTTDQEQVQAEFQALRKLFDELKHTHPSFEVLSMGMSNDYALALEQGSTMIRVGSAIFGARA